MLYTNTPLPFAESKNEWSYTSTVIIPSRPAQGHLYVLHLLLSGTGTQFLCCMGVLCCDRAEPVKVTNVVYI